MFWVARPPRRSALALDCKWTIGSRSRVHGSFAATTMSSGTERHFCITTPTTTIQSSSSIANTEHRTQCASYLADGLPSARPPQW